MSAAQIATGEIAVGQLDLEYVVAARLTLVAHAHARGARLTVNGHVAVNDAAIRVGRVHGITRDRRGFHVHAVAMINVIEMAPERAVLDAGNTILGNTIQSNGQSGVAVCCAGVTNNLVRQNSISGNGAAGIDLVGSNGVYGVTANDPCDTDTGGNDLQNFPVLNYAFDVGGGVIVNGSLNSHANTSYRLEFFASDVCSGSGYGQGKTFLGSANVTTDGSCNANFQTLLNSPVASGQFVTATATDPNNNTSEFSACAPVIAFRLLSIKRQENDVHLMWTTLAGKTNIVQRAFSPGGSFADIGPMIILGGTGQITATYIDIGGATATNYYYRMRLGP
ncbi:MAG: hypothetical protein EPO07_15850 [Verrucomicrobia bacterium]|nr:MAG: hypothetical protein EPO07_15850 [Verrucomicrobiota bacterium]